VCYIMLYKLEWMCWLSLLVMMYLYLLLMYKLKGFILSMTIVSLLYFNNTGLGGADSTWPSPQGPGRFLLSKFQAPLCPQATWPVQGSNSI